MWLDLDNTEGSHGEFRVLMSKNYWIKIEISKFFVPVEVSWNQADFPTILWVANLTA